MIMFYDSDDQMLAAVQMMEEMHEDEDNQLLASLEIIEEMSSDESEVQSQYHVNTVTDDDPPSMPQTECALSMDTVNEYICKSKYVDPITKEQQELNSRIAYFESHQEKTRAFVEDIWKEINCLFINAIHGASQKGKVTNQQLTRFYKQVVNYRSSAEYKVRVAALYGTKEANGSQLRAALEIFNCVRINVVSASVKDTKETATKHAEATLGKTLKESPGGLGKKRYLSGWCVSKLRYSRRSQIRKKLYQKKAKLPVERLNREMKYLDQLVATESYLEEHSSQKETLG